MSSKCLLCLKKQNKTKKKQKIFHIIKENLTTEMLETKTVAISDVLIKDRLEKDFQNGC